MAASTELTNLQQVKNYLGLAPGDTANDALLTDLIAAMSEAVENYCGREFARATRIEYHDGACAPSLVLRCRPAEQIISIHDDLAREFDPGTQVPPSQYVLYEKEGLLKLRYGAFSPGLRNVRVEYVAGFAPLPPAVVQATNILVAHFFSRAQSGADAIASESVGVYSVSYDSGQWPGKAVGLLAEFREIGL